MEQFKLYNVSDEYVEAEDYPNFGAVFSEEYVKRRQKVMENEKVYIFKNYSGIYNFIL